ncbi:MAG: DUF2975 domain-containing protein [Ferruginibacter sp.]|nr:DUF2975 domain-containing protein [Rhodoferax sp.]
MDHIPGLPALGGTRLSQFLAHSCLALAGALPLATLYGLWRQPQVASTVWFTVAGMLPVGGLAYGLLQARQCFQGFVRGEVFSQSTVRRLRGFAAGVVVAAVAGLLLPTLRSLLMAWTGLADRHAVVVEFSSNNMLLLLFAGIVWQIAHVMAQAAALADEHAQIV